MTQPLAIRAYVINLDRATKRWAHIEQIFARAGIAFSRVAAIDGKSLSMLPSFYSEGCYRWRHGKETNPPEVGCYLSHLQALREFLESDAELGLICEDDISFDPDLGRILDAALAGPRCWNMLRLSGLSDGHVLRIRRLDADHWLGVSIGRIKGSGAYLIDRKAAQVLTKQLLPMKLPYDHALDREWFHRLTAACLLPWPINQRQKRFGSSIQTYAQPKLSTLRRWLTTYPYQASNEMLRWAFRSRLYLLLKLRGNR